MRKKNTMEDFGKTRFGWLLRQRGYAYVDQDNLEARIAVKSKRPDYFVETPDGVKLLVEVESFNKGNELDMEPGFKQIGNYDPLLVRIRTAVKHASKQLRDYKDLGIPLLIVLDNWRNRPLMVGSANMREALFGRITFKLPVIDTGSRFLGDPFAVHGSGQVLNERYKCYISAVAMIGRKKAFISDEGNGEKPFRLQVFHNHFTTSPFPLSAFTDPEDVHEGYDPEGTWTVLKNCPVGQN